MASEKKSVSLADLQRVYARTKQEDLMPPKNSEASATEAKPHTVSPPKQNPKPVAKPAPVNVISAEDGNSLLAEINATAEAIDKKQAEAKDQVEILAEARKPGFADKIAQFRKAREMGFPAPVLDKYDRVMMDAKTNPFTQRKLGIAELTGQIKAGTIHYIAAIQRGVEIKALRFANGERVDSSRRLTYWEIKDAKQVIATSVLSDGDTEELLTLLRDYKEEKKQELFKGLEEGKVSVEVAASEGVKLQLGRSEIWSRAVEKKYPRIRFDYNHAFVPWPPEKGDPEYNRESQAFYKRLQYALTREREERNEKLKAYVFELDKVEESGSLRALIEGETGEAVLTDSFKTADGEKKFAVKVARFALGDRLQVVGTTNAQYARKLFAHTSRSGDVKCSAVKVEYEFKRGEGGSFSGIMFKAMDNRLERMLSSRFEKEVSASDIEAVMARQEEIRDVLRENFRREINLEATIAPKDVLKKPGRAAVCRDDWTIRKDSEVRLKYMDALLENDGKTIKVVKASPRVRNYIFGRESGIPAVVAEGSVEERVWKKFCAWVLGSEDMRMAYQMEADEEVVVLPDSIDEVSVPIETSSVAVPSDLIEEGTPPVEMKDIPISPAPKPKKSRRRLPDNN